MSCWRCCGDAAPRGAGGTVALTDRVRTTELQDGDDQSPGHAMTGTRSVDATVPSVACLYITDGRPTVGTGSRTAAEMIPMMGGVDRFHRGAGDHTEGESDD